VNRDGIEEDPLRKIMTMAAVAGALLAAGCDTDKNRQDESKPYRSDMTPPAPSTSPSAANPAPSAGSSDSVTSGSASNAASGSSGTRQSNPPR
jgi:hypothetical protein